MPWWRNAVGYSIYLRSFADTDGNGVGDLAGVEAHLDHLEELGIDLVWITPFYPSPLADFGYDVVDHMAVDPTYGDLAAFDRLIGRIHRRDMRLLIDLVPNHTSIEHPWFRQARADPSGRYRDHYLWRDPAPNGGPPNNWVSYFGGPAWTLDPSSGQYYLHLFLPEQPDLNWRNPAVHRAFERILRFWLDRGVDGFRIDVAQGLVKDLELRSNPQRRRVDPSMDRLQRWDAFDHVHDIAQPETQEVFAAWRAICEEYDAVLVGETSVASADCLAALLPGTGLHAGFWLRPAQLGWHPAALRQALTAPLAAVDDPNTIAWAASTLDERRPASRFGGGDLGRRRSLALSTLLLFLPGLPFLYQGEELGLVDGIVPPRRRVDPVAADPSGGRDGARTPIPWASGPSFDFSTNPDPWLPDGGRDACDTAGYQRGRTGSWFERYRGLIEVRAATGPQRDGDTDIVDLGDDRVIGFRRGGLVVAANLAGRPMKVELRGTVLYNTHDTLESTTGGLLLEEAQAVIVQEGSR